MEQTELKLLVETMKLDEKIDQLLQLTEYLNKLVVIFFPRCFYG
jgi:hypothetical protein